MSRHIRAQTIPTHTSGFHLFTMAMTGHAEERGSTTEHVTVESLLSECSKREQERESGIVSECSKGFFLPGTSEDNNESSSVSSNSSSERRLLRGNKTDKQRKNTINAMQQYDA